MIDKLKTVPCASSVVFFSFSFVSLFFLLYLPLILTRWILSALILWLTAPSSGGSYALQQSGDSSVLETAKSSVCLMVSLILS